MRSISVHKITEVIEGLVIKANTNLNPDIFNELAKSIEHEESAVGKDILKKLLKNAEIAKDEEMAICQDTGMTVVFIELGQEVCFSDGFLEDAINEGVRRGYEKGYLRKSVVEDPLLRNNTKDNTPAVIHYNIVKGNKLKILVSPKGFGSENMSRIKMLNPSDGIQGVKDFVKETVCIAGPNPCPPIIIGIGIGGTFEKCAFLAKKALQRPINERNKLEHVNRLEEELLDIINKTGIGPSGLGGRVTALSVNIEVYPTHIAGLPVAINISCHATRHAEAIL